MGQAACEDTLEESSAISQLDKNKFGTLHTDMVGPTMHHHALALVLASVDDLGTGGSRKALILGEGYMCLYWL